MVGLPSVACPLPGASPLRPGKGGENPSWRSIPKGSILGVKIQVPHWQVLSWVWITLPLYLNLKAAKIHAGGVVGGLDDFVEAWKQFFRGVFNVEKVSSSLAASATCNLYLNLQRFIGHCRQWRKICSPFRNLSKWCFSWIIGLDLLARWSWLRHWSRWPTGGSLATSALLPKAGNLIRYLSWYGSQDDRWFIKLKIATIWKAPSLDFRPKMWHFTTGIVHFCPTYGL